MSHPITAAYPALANFLAAYFSDADLEGRTTDEAIVDFFRQVTLPKDVRATRRELQAVLALRPLPMVELARIANRNLADEPLARAWLSKLLGLLGAQSGH